GVILVVEDDEGVRLTTQELLMNLGYQVEIASTPEEGLKLYAARQGQVDLLLTDVVMPGMSGPEMVSELRKHYPDMRVLFMSGHTPQEFQRRGLLKPEDDILQKPFTVRELAEKIHEKII
ncbi:MAG: response regulator, partial [bacterium]